MSKLEILPGHTYDVVSPQELDAHFHQVNARLDEMVREVVRGVKVIRFRSNKINVAVNATSFVCPSIVAPQSGFVWSIAHVVLASTAVPHNAMFARSPDPTVAGFSAFDINIPESLNILLDTFNTTSRGTFSALTYSKGAMIFQAGEFPMVVGTGSGTSATTMQMQGTAYEVPAEMVGKLIL